jgi:hypothetical protein
MSKLNRSSEIWISLATPSVLVALIAGKALAEMMKNLGQASEEIFRGDRLPTLHVPVAPADSTPSDSQSSL